MATSFKDAAERGLTAVRDSQGQSTRNSDRYPHFLKCLRLWEAMLPKKAADEVSGELLARGFWRMLGEKLTEREMSNLTEMVLDRCRWFPTVAECRELMGEASYSNPFYVERRRELLDRNDYPALAAPTKAITDQR